MPSAKVYDTDLLVLFSGSPDYASELEQTTELLRGIRRAEEETVDELYRWPIMPIPGVEAASDLDPDFVATTGRGGVLLYHRSDTLLPEPLAQLEPFDSWMWRVKDELAGRGLVLDRPPA